MGLGGIERTLVGLFLVVAFECVDPYPLVGIVIGLVGVAVFAVGAFGE